MGVYFWLDIDWTSVLTSFRLKKIWVVERRGASQRRGGGEETDFGQSRFRHPDSTNFGQSILGQSIFLANIFGVMVKPHRVGAKPRESGGPRRVGPQKGGAPEGWGPRRVATPGMATDGCAQWVGARDSGTKATVRVGQLRTALFLWAGVQGSSRSPVLRSLPSHPHKCSSCCRRCFGRGKTASMPEVCKKHCGLPGTRARCLPFQSGWSRARMSWNGPGRECQELQTS